MFKYLVFNNQNLLSDLLLTKPLLFKKAIAYIDWLIINYGQTKPWEFVRLLPDWLLNIHKQDPNKCWLPNPCQGNPKVPHHSYKNPHWQKRDLSYWLIKCGRAFLKTDNRPHTDADVEDTTEEQQLQQPWRREMFQQYEKLAQYLGNWLIPTPSGGFQMEHQRIRSHPALKSSRFYYSSKITNFESLHCGEVKGKGQGVVHPLSQGYLGTINEETLEKWIKWQKKNRRKQKRSKTTKAFQKYFNPKIYQKFGFRFTNQPCKKETTATSITRDSQNDLTNSTIFDLHWKQLTEQKTTDYHPVQFTFRTESLGETKQMILNTRHSCQKQLTTYLIKNANTSLQFQLLQLSQGFRLQRWKSEEFTKWKNEQNSLMLPAYIPKKPEKTRWKESVQKSAYGKIFGNFQQIILTTKSGERCSVLFNLESGRIKEPFLNQQIGDFANNFCLKAGTDGAFIQL